jgi:hypothetical protein
MVSCCFGFNFDFDFDFDAGLGRRMTFRIVYPVSLHIDESHRFRVNCEDILLGLPAANRSSCPLAVDPKTSIKQDTSITYFHSWRILIILVRSTMCCHDTDILYGRETRVCERKLNGVQKGRHIHSLMVIFIFFFHTVH